MRLPSRHHLSRIDNSKEGMKMKRLLKTTIKTIAPALAAAALLCSTAAYAGPTEQASALIAFSTSAGNRDHHGSSDYYRSSDGSMVHRPERRGHHGHEAAICGDGTHSYSHHHRGTCSHHHGVAKWE
jgi:hypothetical protein